MEDSRKNRTPGQAQDQGPDKKPGLVPESARCQSAGPGSRVLRIGVTGGIGSGKSLVMEILKKDYGAEIILSDLLAHELMEPGARSYQDIVQAFGTGILDGEGRIDRLKLSAIVFADPRKLARLNAITHPNVIQEIRDRMTAFARQWDQDCQDRDRKQDKEQDQDRGQNRDQGVVQDQPELEKKDNNLDQTRDKARVRRKQTGIIVVESALLLESGMAGEFDSLWYVYADRQVRLQRLMEGRAYTEDRARSVMSRQKEEAYYRDRCQVVIDNSADPEQTASQVRRAMAELLV